MFGLSNDIEKVLSRLEHERLNEILLEKQGGRIRGEDRSLAIPRDEGKFLYVMALIINAKRVIEIGTSFGYSTIWLAAAMRRTGGLVKSLDVNAAKIKVAKENIKEAGLSPQVELLNQDAKLMLENYSMKADLIFLDADKQDYIEFITLSLKLLRRGGILLTDNILDCYEIHKDNPALCDDIQTYLSDQKEALSLTIPFVPNGLALTIKI